MSWETDITQAVANLTNRLNQITTLAKKIYQLPLQSILNPSSEIHVSIGGESQKINIQQILDASLSYKQNQLIEAVISVVANDVTVDTGSEWIINNVNHETTSDFTETIPYAETGYTRNDILVGNESNIIYRIVGPETEGVSPTPNVPINTVLITTINVTDATIGYVPPIIGTDFEVKINKQNTLATDGTGNKYPTVDAVNSGLSTKLDISSYNDRFKGVYVTEAALNVAHPTASAGDYAQVNETGSTDVVNYNWDAEENIWVEGGSGGSGATNTDMLPEGSVNLYFTTARVLATLLTGISFVTGGAIVSTDSVLIAFGKIQKQINDLIITSKYEELAYACSDESSNLTVGTLITFRMPFAMTLSSVKISTNTAPTVSTLIVDVKESGVSIFSTLLSIDATEKTSVTAAVPAVISDVNLADDAELTVMTTQVGSGIAGTGLKITFIGTRV